MRFAAVPRRALVAGTTAVLVACSGPSGDSGSSPGPPQSATSAPSPGSSPAATFAEPAAVLDVAVQEPATLDPMRLASPGSLLVARQLFEGLTAWDPVGETVVPAAAESWTVADGGTTFVFRLRPGMTFHDGAPVTAFDFVYAFDRIALKANASDLAYLLENIVGFDAVNGAGTADHLEGLEVPDPLSLVIRLAAPYHDLPMLLTHPALVPLSQPAVQDYEDFVVLPTGNGPWRLVSPWRPGDEILLEPHAGYGVVPALQGLRFVPFPDPAASWLPFVEGDLDVAQVPPGQVDDAAERFGDDGFVPLLGAYFYGLRLDAEALADRRVRRAVNLAIDRERLARDVFRGTIVPPRGIIPHGLPDIVENVCVDVCELDLARARRLVDDLPRHRRELTLQFTKGDPHARVARAIGNDLEHAGFEVTRRGFAFSSFLRLLRSGEAQAFRLGWFGEYPSADLFVGPLFGSSSPENFFGFASDKVDRLIAEAHGEPSPARRTQLYIAAEKAILRTLPIVPLGSYVSHWAAQPWVEGLHIDVTGGFDTAGVTLAAQEG